MQIWKNIRIKLTTVKITVKFVLKIAGSEQNIKKIK